MNRSTDRPGDNRTARSVLLFALCLFLFSALFLKVAEDALPLYVSLIVVAIVLGSVLFAFFYLLIATAKKQEIIPFSIAQVLTFVASEREANLRDLNNLKEELQGISTSSHYSLVDKMLWVHRVSAFIHYEYHIKGYSVSPEFGAVCTTAVVLIFYILATYTGLVTADMISFNLTQSASVAMGALLVVGNYLYLAKGSRFERIKREFAGLTENKLSKYRKIVFAYTSLSFILFAFSLWLLSINR